MRWKGLTRIALEGPSLSGKSTLAERLFYDFRASGARCVQLPDFFDTYTPLDIHIPLDPKNPVEQLLIVTLHIGLEMSRHCEMPNDTEIAILDRSLWTPLAHTYALIATGILADARCLNFHQLIASMDQWLPDLVLYVDTPFEVRMERKDTRADLPEFHLSRRFSDALREFYSKPWPNLNVHLLNGGTDIGSLKREAWDIIREEWS